MSAITYLVAAHRNPAVFGELVRALHPERVIAHIDRKADLGSFERECPPDDRIEYLHDRVDVTWGGWSQVQVMLALLRRAADGLERDDYAILLSGDAFPLQPQIRIRQFLDSANGEQFIEAVQMSGSTSGRLERLSFGSLTRLSQIKIQSDPRGAVNPFVRLLNGLRIPRPYRRALAGREPYCGGQWWAFSAEAVRWILDDIRQDDRLLRFCARSAVPDEFFFQTMLMASPFRARVRPSLMFVDWSAPEGWSPATLGPRHVELFGRAGVTSGELRRLGMVPQRGNGVLPEPEGSTRPPPMLFARKVADPALARRIRDEVWTSAAPPVEGF